MDKAGILIAFYSRTGTTRRVAETLARALDADLEEVRDTKSREGLTGYLRAGLDALLDRGTELRPLLHDPGDYGLVIIGTPVWNASVSTPIRAWMELSRGELANVAFFLTCGGRGQARVFRRMETVSGRRPVATLAVRHRVVAHGRHVGPVRDFAERILRGVREIPEVELRQSPQG